MEKFGFSASFIFGLLASVSTCAALVGGLVLAMSKQWLSLHAPEADWKQKMQPHLLFGIGRLFSYALGGFLLGLIGSKLEFSPMISAIVVLAVSVILFITGLQMLGIKSVNKIQFHLPHFLIGRLVDEQNFKGKLSPFILGSLTFFLPCGFTLTAQGAALVTGSWWQGGLIMLFFALGTLPSLLLIGLFSIKLISRPRWSNNFLKFAGMAILFFSLFNVNAQMNALGLPSLSDWKKAGLITGSTKEEPDLPPLVNGKQIIKMSVSSSGYLPDYFKVRVDVPVRWEIKDEGAGGCTNAILARGLFAGQINLQPGATIIKEFTPRTIGRFKFSCWMGMVNGIMEVIKGKS